MIIKYRISAPEGKQECIWKYERVGLCFFFSSFISDICFLTLSAQRLRFSSDCVTSKKLNFVLFFLPPCCLRSVLSFICDNKADFTGKKLCQFILARKLQFCGKHLHCRASYLWASCFAQNICNTNICIYKGLAALCFILKMIM